MQIHACFCWPKGKPNKSIQPTPSARLISNVSGLPGLDSVAQRATLTAMIKSFKHKGLEEFFNSGTTRGIQSVHANKLRMQLAALNTATTIEDMNIPGYRLHPLKGDRKGIWSITVNGNWRVTFEFTDGNAYIVTYEDYH